MAIAKRLTVTIGSVVTIATTAGAIMRPPVKVLRINFTGLVVW